MQFTLKVYIVGGRIVDIRTECDYYGDYFTAIDIDSFCGCQDCTGLVGFGNTAEEAVEDLKQQMAEV